MGNAKAAKKYVVKIGTVGTPAVVVDRSNNFTQVDFEENVELLESTAFQDTDKTYETSFKDNKWSGQGNWTGTLDGHLGALLGIDPLVSFELGPEGSATGGVKYTGQGRVTSFKKSGGVKSLNTFTTEFQISGPVTRGTY